MQALACSPWVCRVTRKDVCSTNASRRGERAEDGQILRAKRRLPPTARDRARAYAFERIPPSKVKNHEGTTVGIGGIAEQRPWTTNRLDPRCSSGDTEQKGDIEKLNASFTPAGLAHGATVGSLIATKHGGHSGRSGKQGQHLMPPAAVESSVSTPFAAAPSCKIDLRGCSKRSPPLPLADAESEAERGTPPAERTPTQVVGLPSDGRNGRRREVGRLRDRHRGRIGLESGGHQNNGGHTARLTDGNADPPDLAVMAGAPLRSIRHSRWRKSITLDDRSLYPLKSEAEEIDELTSLLRVSRRIFSKAQGFEEVVKHSEDQRVSMARSHAEQGSWTTALKMHRSGGAVSAQGENVELSRAKGVGGQLTSSAAGGNAPRERVLRVSNSSPPDRRLQSRRNGAGQGGSSSSRRGRVADHLACDPDKPLLQGQSSQTALIRATGLEGPRGRGDGHDYDASHADVDGAHKAVVSVEGTSAPFEGNRPSDASDMENSGGQMALDNTAVRPENHRRVDGSLAVSFETTDPVSNKYHPVHPPEDSSSPPPPQPYAEQADATQQADDINNALPFTEGGYTTEVVDAANWYETQEEADNGGWTYDEATSSWVASAIVGGETNDHVDEGWRYDEQTSSWYQDESVWHIMRDPHEPPIAQIPESAAVAADNANSSARGTSGDDDRDTIRSGYSQKQDHKLLLDRSVGDNVRGGLNWRPF